MKNHVREAAEALAPWLSETRRGIHQEPELGYEEYKTSAFVAECLSGWGVEVKSGVAETGVVGLLRTGREGPTIGIRADMDALPVDEVNDVPYKSRHEGKMHACGHDAHTTMLLGTARLLAENRGWLEGAGGNVKFIFQPAEEGKAGGKRMVEEGILEDPRVDILVAAHVWPTLETGKIGTRSGPVLAATDKFFIQVKGKSGHAAYPHQSHDPIVAASHLVTMLQSVVSRRVGPFEAAVLSVTGFESGVAINIIPEVVRIQGTIRTHDPDLRERVRTHLREIVGGVDTSFGLETEVEIVPGYPALENHSSACALIEKAGREVLGEENVGEMPLSMGAEDFAYMAMERPGALFRLGIRNEARGIVHGLHSNRFDIDESAMPIGVSVFAQSVVEFLSDSRAYLA